MANNLEQEDTKNAQNFVTYHGYLERVLNEVARMAYVAGDDTDADMILSVEQAQKNISKYQKAKLPYRQQNVHIEYFRIS